MHSQSNQPTSSTGKARLPWSRELRAKSTSNCSHWPRKLPNTTTTKQTIIKWRSKAHCERKSWESSNTLSVRISSSRSRLSSTCSQTTTSSSLPRTSASQPPLWSRASRIKSDRALHSRKRWDRLSSSAIHNSQSTLSPMGSKVCTILQLSSSRHSAE